LSREEWFFRSIFVRDYLSGDMTNPIRIFFHHLTAIIAMGLLGTSGWAASDAETKTLTGVIVEVTSGDSFLLRTEDNREIPLKVWGIDSPEINNKTGQRARKFTARLIEGDSVVANVKAKAKDGRIVCRVFFDGNRDLAEELLKEGYAVWVTSLAPDEAAYEAAQTMAQDKRRGLWKQWLPKLGL
jgi:endonuclease YncB( thermonuclease family)